MTVFFSGIVDCNPDEPPGHAPIPDQIILEQLAAAPCIWFGAPSEYWHSHYKIDIPNVSYQTLKSGIYFYFEDTKPEHASKTFINELTCSDAEPGGSGGTAFVPSHQVTIALKNDREAFRIANTYNFSPPRLSYQTPGLELDTGEYEPDLKPAAEVRCVKLLHDADATSILLLHKPAETYG